MRSRLGVPLLIAALGLLFFVDLVRHPSETLYSDCSDLLTLHLPARRFLVRSWQETGEVPLWCPYQFGGMPFVHDLQSSAFYPPHWPLYCMPEEWMGPALSWLVVFHVILAGWCSYAYARWQGLGRTGALTAAVGFMFAGKWLLHVLAGGHYNMVPLAWLPLVLLWLEQAIRRRSLVKATAAGGAFSLLVLGAYPYVTLYSGVFVAVWTLGTALEEAGYLDGEGPRSGRRTVSALGWWAGFGIWAATVAVGLGAVQLLPGLEAAAAASRSAGVGLTPQLFLDGLHSLVGLVGPPVSDAPNSWENRAGLGVLWLSLAVVAPLAGGRRVRFQTAVLIGMLGFVLGGAALVQWLPGFRLFRLPSRMFLVAALPLALLAGRAIEALAGAPSPNEALRGWCRKILLRVGGAVVMLAVVYGVALRSRHDISAQFHPYWISLLITVPVAWWLLGGAGASAKRQVWLVILLVDLWALSWPLVETRSDAEVFTPSACVRYLEQHRDLHGRVLDFNPGSYLTAANHTPLWPGLPLVERIEAVRGFNPIDVRRYKEFLQLITDDDRPLAAIDQLFTGPVLGTFPIRNQTLADLLGIRYLVQPDDLSLELTVPAPEAHKTWTVVADDPAPTTFNFISVTPGGRDCGRQALPPYRVYENKGVLPRAFVVPEAAPLPGRSDVLPALRSADFRRLVYLERSGLDAQSTRGSGYRSAVVREYLPNRVRLDVQGGEGGYLVLTDVWFPGWTCVVDGRELPVYRANFLFRAVELPAGAREVVFSFAPESYRWGRMLTAATAVVVIGLVLVSSVLQGLRARGNVA